MLVAAGQLYGSPTGSSPSPYRAPIQDCNLASAMSRSHPCAADEALPLYSAGRPRWYPPRSMATTDHQSLQLTSVAYKQASPPRLIPHNALDRAYLALLCLGFTGFSISAYRLPWPGSLPVCTTCLAWHLFGRKVRWQGGGAWS